MLHSTQALALTTRARNRLLALVGAIAMLLPSVVFSPTPAHAALATGLVGGFEIDGDMTSDGALDWDTSPAPDDDGFADDDDIVIQGNNGGKENSDPYVFDVGNVNDKDDITKVYLDSDITGPDRAYIWGGFERLSGNGSAHVIFEFNQAAINDFHVRAGGDLRMSFTYGGQGQNESASAGLETWTGTEWVDATTEGLATINSVSTQPPDGTIVSADGERTLHEREFGEMGVDLRGYFDNPNFQCASLSTVWVRTRASASETANVFDKAGPYSIDIDLCSEINVKKVDDAGAPMEGVQFTLYQDDPDNGTQGVFDAEDDVVDTADTDAAGIASFGGLNEGDYFVEETESLAGYVVDDTVVGPISVGFKDTVNVWEDADGIGDGTTGYTFENTLIVYQVKLTPLEAENLVGTDHVFVATLERSLDRGETWAAVSGETLDISLSGLGSITAIDDGSVDEGDTSGECTTADGSGDLAAGTCEITINSSDPGSSTLHASYDGPDATTRVAPTSASANKSWTDFLVTVGDDGRNLVGTAHTFTVTLEVNDGTGWDGLGDATVALDWDGVGNITHVNGSADPDATSCETDGDGQCTVTVDSDATGDGTLSASYSTTLDSGQHTFPRSGDTDAEEAASADKTWIDYAIDVDPDEATNRVGFDHDFTVTLTQDTGSGFGPLAGATVDLDWTGSQALSSDTCTTDSNGQCTVTVSDGGSAESGTLTASYADDSLDSYTEATAAAHTTSDSGDKDWVDYAIDVDPDEAINLVGQDHEFTITLTGYDTDNPNGTPLAGATVDLDWTGSQALSSDTCTTDSNGQCTVTVSDGGSAESGTLTASYADDSLDSYTEATAAAHTTSDSGDKEWVTYGITVEADGVNLAGEPHTFTVTLSSSDGQLAPVASQSVTLDWSGDGAITHVNGSEDADATSCTTDGSGQCTVTVSHDAAGDGELTATFVADGLDSYDDDSAEDHTFSDSATKDWVSYTLRVSPETATNLLPTEPTHTFTVTLGSSDAELAPVGGQTVALSLDSSVAWIVQVNGVDVDDTRSTTCVTKGNGTCEVVAETTQAGDATLSASYEASDGDAETTVSSDPDGYKLWTTFQVTVTPDSAQNLVGDPHTFTVTIEQTDDGSNWSAVSGAEPTITLTYSGDMNADNADVSGTCFDPGATNDSGQCTVVVNSDVTGAVVAKAEYQGAVGEQTAAFSDSGSKTFIDYDISISPLDDENLVDTDHIFTVTVQVDLGDGEGLVPLAGAHPTVSILDGPGSEVSDDCATNGTGEDGTCTYTITSSETGGTTVQASYLGTAADSEPREYSSDEANKTWEDYAITVDPLTAVNPIGTTHTFTVTLTHDAGDGEGFQPAAEETVALTLTGPGNIISVDGVAVEATTTTTCVTDDAGQCDVTILSNETGTSNLEASYHGVVGDTERDFPASAEKIWVSNPDIAVTKTATITRDGEAVEGPAEMGDVVEYSYTVENTGDVRLTNVTLSDVFTISGVDLDALEVLDAPLALAAGESADLGVLHTWTVTEDDLPGPIDNVVTATGEAPDGEEVSDTDVATVPLTFSPSVSLTKEADVEVAAMGDTITYTYVITNTGDVTLTNVTLDDDVLGEIIGVDGVSPLTLAPGESVTTVVEQTATEADLPGPIVNTAVTTGTPPVGDDVDDTAVESVELTSSPAISVVKTPDVTGAVVGDTITYTYVITNAGDVTLSDVTGVDDILGALALPVTTLAPGDEVTVQLTHTVVEADLPGPVINTVVATGTPPVGPDVSDEDDAQVSLSSSPSIEVVKNAEVEPDVEGFKTVAFNPDDGDDETIDYTYVVTNTGDVTLTNVTLVDDVLGEITLADTTLEPGQSTTGTATHIITQADADAFEVANIADVSGVAPDGTVVEDQDDELVDITITLPLIIENPPPLPVTGFENGGSAAVALGMIALGILALREAERRERRKPTTD